MTLPAPKHIVILGGGTAGWIAANLMVKAWGQEQAKITLIESPDIGIIGVGEGSTPSLKRFFEVMGIAERDWMPACNATYKLSIRFEGWSPATGIKEYSHPFFSQVDVHTEEAFTLNCRNRRLGHDVPTQPDDFFLNAVLAAKGKSPVAGPNFPFQMEYGYHFDSAALGRFLGEVACERGANHISARIARARRHENGDIAALITEEGEEIAGDIFIDCSGFSGVLMEKALGVPFISFAGNLFNDAAVVMPTPPAQSPVPETKATALSNGWCWNIPLQNRDGNGYVYSSAFLEKDAAEAEMRAHLGVSDGHEGVRHLRFKVGQLARHWDNNCVALGLSQGFIEPLEATAIHLVLNTVEQFIKSYEGGGFSAKNREGFNQNISAKIGAVRDYIVAHYKLNTRQDSEYWRANAANMALSPSLQHILDVWFRRGDLAAELARQENLSHFGSASWHCLLAGYGAFPEVSEPARDDVDFYTERRIAAFLEGCSRNFESHEEALSRPHSSMQ